MAPADQLTRVFLALADPTRRHMVARLALADATVNERERPGAEVRGIAGAWRVALRIEAEGRVARPGEAARDHALPGRTPFGA
jgi:hypothetical protein